MDNAQKAIMIGVGLFITIIVIAAVMLITGIGQDLLNSGTQKAGDISANLQAQDLVQYDGTTMTGSQVQQAVKNNMKTSNMVVSVTNKVTTVNWGTKSLSADKKSLVDNTSAPKVGTMSTPSNTNNYINPTAQFAADLVKIGDNVVGIKFVQK